MLEIILSHPEYGAHEDFTLTNHGENQVRDFVKEAKEKGFLDSETMIYSSPFSRCVRSAQIATEVLGVKNDIIIDERLRERWFGDYERQHNSNYQKVWDHDANDAHHKNDNVESTQEVQERTLALISDLEAKYTGKKILLVSHGDVLQILQTGILKKSPGEHRQLSNIRTGEVKKLISE